MWWPGQRCGWDDGHASARDGGASAGGARVELRVLGPLEAVVDSRLVDLGPSKQRALLALLASQVGRPVAVDVLLEELWSGAPPPAAMVSLRAYVANLRRASEPDRPPRAPATVLRATTGRPPRQTLTHNARRGALHQLIGRLPAGAPGTTLLPSIWRCRRN